MKVKKVEHVKIAAAIAVRFQIGCYCVQIKIHTVHKNIYLHTCRMHGWYYHDSV